MPRLTYAVLPWLVLLSACTAPQKPYQFMTPQLAREPIEALATAFGQNGHLPIVVEPQTGTVQARWLDGGAAKQQMDGKPAHWVRRFSAVLTRGAFGNEVQLSLQLKLCEVGEFRLTETDVQGNCLNIDPLPAEHKADLYALGERLQRALSVP